MTAHVPPEEWRPVPGYEGLYAVSDQGRVMSFKAAEPRLLALTTLHKGYPQVWISKPGTRWIGPVYRLVALAFIGPLPLGMQTRHLDGDRANSAASNLAYGTPAENARDRVQHGTDVGSRKTHCVRGHAYDEVNTYRYGGKRTCRACRALLERDRRRRIRRERGAA